MLVPGSQSAPSAISIAPDAPDARITSSAVSTAPGNENLLATTSRTAGIPALTWYPLLLRLSKFASSPAAFGGGTNVSPYFVGSPSETSIIVFWGLPRLSMRSTTPRIGFTVRAARFDCLMVLTAAAVGSAPALDAEEPLLVPLRPSDTATKPASGTAATMHVPSTWARAIMIEE
eukprot:Amastigsp_a510586_96.p3 type:complete len:175 gc:universal Amastigsp_a510586_96:544-20(-)